MDPSAPIILQSWVQFQSTTSILFSIYKCDEKRTEINKKRPGRIHIRKTNQKYYTKISYKSKCLVIHHHGVSLRLANESEFLKIKSFHKWCFSLSLSQPHLANFSSRKWGKFLDGKQKKKL